MKERAPPVASQYLAEGARGSKSGHFFSPQTRKTRARRANVRPCKSPSLPGLRAIPFHSKLHSKRSQTMKRRSNHVLFMTSSTGKILLFEEEEFYPSLFLRLSVSIRPGRHERNHQFYRVCRRRRGRRGGFSVGWRNSSNGRGWGEGGGIFADDGGILLRSVRRVGDVDDDSSADIRYVGGR